MLQPKGSHKVDQGARGYTVGQRKRIPTTTHMRNVRDLQEPATLSTTTTMQAHSTTHALLQQLDDPLGEGLITLLLRTVSDDNVDKFLIHSLNHLATNTAQTTNSLTQSELQLHKELLQL